MLHKAIVDEVARKTKAKVLGTRKKDFPPDVALRSDLPIALFSREGLTLLKPQM